jgi:putative ABC transport system permease protein
MWTGTTSLTYKGLKSGRSLNFGEKQIADVNNQLVETSNQTGVITKQLTITNKSEFGTYDVKGVNPSYDKVFNLKFEPNEGRFINILDNKESNKVIVIDKKIEEVLFKGTTSLGKYVKVGDLMFRIIGINSKKARFDNGTAFIPYSTAQTIFNPDMKFNNIAMSVNGLSTQKMNDDFNDKLKKTMSNSLSYDKNDPQAVYIQNSQRDFLQTMMIFKGITIFVAVIGIFTLIAGIVGVSNIMLVTVKERTREIGIRKAIGAPPATILKSIITESIIITTIFGYVGMMAGIGLTELVNYIMLQSAAGNPNGPTVFKNPTVELSYVLISTAILIIAGVIAGYMPARRAVRIKPIEAMREE